MLTYTIEDKDGKKFMTERNNETVIRQGFIESPDDNPEAEITWETIYNILYYKRIRIIVLEA